LNIVKLILKERNENMKRKIALLALLAVFAAIAASGTIAYFTSETHAHNVITSGGIDIELFEWKERPSDNNPEGVPFENLNGVMPSQTVNKIVEVKNTGANDAYVRIFLQKAIAQKPSGIIGAIGEIFNPPVCPPLTIQVGNETVEVIQLDINTTDWQYNEDDCYYYYNSKLKPGEVTTPLFNTVTLAPQMGNEYQNTEIYIDVTAEATQVANNGANALEAQGWPDGTN